MNEKTYTPTKKEIHHRWFVVDAEGKVLGRLASEVAQVLRGKRRPDFTPQLDLGDHVVVVNAGKVRVTGRKAEQKIYYRHTGFPGGIKETSYSAMLEQHPERIVEKAVWGMLPHNSLGRQLLKKLRVYPGPEHRHEAQQPQPLQV